MSLRLCKVNNVQVVWKSDLLLSRACSSRLTLWWSIGFEMLVILAVAVFMHACITYINMEQESGHINDIVKLQFEQSSRSLLNSIGDLIDAKMSGREKQATSTFTFKKKGNQMQHEVNTNVSEHLNAAKTLLLRSHSADCDHDEVQTGIKRAHDHIEDAIDVLGHRNKLIKLADMSEAGWAAVSEYETHQLAEDSEDEKRIQKAETRALRKIKEGQKKRNAKRSRFLTPVSSTVTSSNVQQLQQSASRKPGVCFSCGKPGHWKSECLAAKSMSSERNDSRTNAEMFKISNYPLKYVHKCIGVQKPCETPNIDVDENNHDTVVTVHDHSNKTIIDRTHPGNTQVGCISKNNATISPVGRLKSSLQKWQSSGANNRILHIIKSGYKLPLMSIPSRTYMQNNASATKNGNFVDLELTKLLDIGCISKCNVIPYIVNPLTVSINKSGKERLVLDCRYTNLHLYKSKFKMEDTQTARNMFKSGDLGFRFDLKSAYHHISVDPDHRKYLGFAWKSN